MVWLVIFGIVATVGVYICVCDDGSENRKSQGTAGH